MRVKLKFVSHILRQKEEVKFRVKDEYTNLMKTKIVLHILYILADSVDDFYVYFQGVLISAVLASCRYEVSHRVALAGSHLD